MNLLVMRLADMKREHPLQDNSRVCSRCFQQVGIYPSGQAALRQYPDMVPVCTHCTDAEAIMNNLTPEIIQEMQESRWRKR